MTAVSIVPVPDCLIETTCGHPLKSGDVFFVYRNPPTWHWDPGFPGHNGDSARIEVLCVLCHKTRTRSEEEANV